MKRLAINSNIATSRTAQQGAVLVITLVLLMVLTLIGVSLARRQTVEQHITTNDQMHAMALQSAEAALRSGESGIGTTYAYADFSNQTAGQYRYDGQGSHVPVDLDFNNPGSATSAYTGAPLAGTTTAPQIVIEWIGQFAAPGQSTGKCNNNCNTAPPDHYEVTVHATGGDQTASSTLKSIYHQ